MTTNNKKMEELKEDYTQIKMNEEQKKELMKTMEQAKKDKRRKNNNYKGILAAAAVAAFVVLPNTSAGVAQAMANIPLLGNLVQVVTFRDYEYEDERNVADVEISEVVVDAANAENVSEENKENLQSTAKEINAEIRGIADRFVREFEENMKHEEGYQDVIVKSEITQTTEEYFTIKLICYRAEASGVEWNYYYTIDLKTGERLELKNLFVDGTDYKTPISENIKEQMQAQMDADENVSYWLNDEDMEEWNFKTITDETEFYLNENNEIVISFNEGEVAAMYMGVVQFTIPNEVVEGIRK